MGGAPKETRQLPLVVRGRHNCDIVQVACAFPWIVGDIDVAFKDVFASNTADKVADRIGHRVHVTGRARHRLGQHLTCSVIDACGQITGFAHGCRKRGANQCLRLFFYDRNHAVPHDLIGNV